MPQNSGVWMHKFHCTNVFFFNSLFFQTVNEVFIQIVLAIERAEGGGTPEKTGGCSVS